MKKIIDLIGPHSWDKINPVTKFNKQGGYDQLICKNCRIKGKRYGFSERIVLDKQYSDNTVYNCDGTKKLNLPYLIKIIKCAANNPEFENIKPGSIHRLVTPPEGYSHDYKGVWIMGVSEPVKVLNNEFTIFLNKRKK